MFSEGRKPLEGAVCTASTDCMFLHFLKKLGEDRQNKAKHDSKPEFTLNQTHFISDPFVPGLPRRGRGPG